MVSLYDPTVPTGRVDLDTDYKNLQNNFAQLDTSFAVNHYAFSNQTANNGFHNRVTTPLVVGGVHPATAANVPDFYAMKDGTNAETIQYSRGGNNAVPSPVTSIQSPAAPINLLNNGTTNIYDFTGITLAIAEFWAICTGTFVVGGGSTTKFIFWNGAAFLLGNQAGSALVLQQAPGNILQLLNSSGVPRNGISWTLRFLRVES